MKGEEYTCASCGGVFKQRTSDNDAWKEYERDFPNCIREEAEMVCHDCWKRMTKKIPPPGRKSKPFFRLKLKPKAYLRFLFHPFAYRKVRKWMNECTIMIEKQLIDEIVWGKEVTPDL